MSKECPKCGTALEDNAVSCHECGHLFTNTPVMAQAPHSSHFSASDYPAQSYSHRNTAYEPSAKTDTHTGMVGWMGWFLLATLLPIVGLIIAVLFARDPSVKTWADAQLLVGIIVILGLVLLFTVGGLSLSNFGF